DQTSAAYRQIGRTSNARRVGILDRDGLDTRCAIAALVRRAVSSADDKMTGAIARTDRIPLPAHRHRSAAVVARRHAVGVRDRHLAGATHRQSGWTRDAWRVGIVDRDGLRAGGAVAALVRCSVCATDDKLTQAIARTDRISL